MLNTKTKTLYTDYATAAHWGGTQLIMCNNLPEIDPTVWDNVRFNLYDEDDNMVDKYQYFITDLSDWQVQWQEERFPDLKYTYSELLDKYILCVDHWGTAWDYVATDVDAELVKINPEIEFKH